MRTRPLIGIPCLTLKSKAADSVPRYSVNQATVHAITQAGGSVVLVPPMEKISLEIISRKLSGLVLEGGADIDPEFYEEEPIPQLEETDPKRDKLELTIVQWALEFQIPVLGICRGMHMLNVAAGGTLYQDISSQRPEAGRHRYHPEFARDYTAHEIQIQPNTNLSDIFGYIKMGVNSMHHQAVKETAPGFIVNAMSDDGIIEGIESTNHQFVMGVQWHPEEMLSADARMHLLFDWFIKVSRPSS